MTAPQAHPDERRPTEGRRPWEPPTVKVLGNMRDIVHDEKGSHHGEGEKGR
jgi:hypothetical protein